ncbi:MAG: dipeptide epimerase [Candidatus Eisenbacteria bacterium]|nr:dipeptide epimerase [Candidatus Eisenbacteria bacterium]
MELSYEIVELVPRFVFRTARNTSASSESVIVTISDGSLTGMGEAAPSRFYGEDTESVVAYLERMRPGVEHAAHESELMAILTSRGGTEDPAARASLEIAAHDMMGRRYHMPLYRHFDLDPSDMPHSTISIGLDSPKVMLEKAREVEGFPLLKIKLDSKIDLSIVERIKEATGASVTVDANCAWGPDEAIEKVAALAEIGVELVEQPVAADDIDGLRRVTESADVPVYADESCPTSAHLPRVADAVDGIVIKLMKCGGLLDAVRMATLARERGLGTMIGCMMESSLALTASAHIAPLMDYADLDGGFLLSNDPFDGMRIDRGRIVLPEGDGLGVRPAVGGA